MKELDHREKCVGQLFDACQVETVQRSTSRREDVLKYVAQLTESHHIGKGIALTSPQAATAAAAALL